MKGLTREKFERGRLKRFKVRVYRVKEMCEVTVETWSAGEARDIAMGMKGKVWRAPDTKFITEAVRIPRVTEEEQDGDSRGDQSCDGAGE